MTNTKTLLKALLGASALTVFATGTAQAQTKTLAGTSVSNTFTLDYNVGGVAQPQIDSTATPTVFTVDRLVDLTVTSNSNTTVVPGATDQELVYSVSNEGNDTQAYALTVIEETTATVTADTFDTDDPAGATPSLVYYIDDGNGTFEPGGADGAPVTYNASTPPQLAPDEVLWVVVTQDIPTSASDTDEAHVSLLAETLDPASGTPVTADTNGNSLTGAAENVLADAGTTSPNNDNPNDGNHSATGAYIVAAADISGDKAVVVHSQDGTDCDSFAVPAATPTPAGPYAIPGACVEYVITVENTGSADATDVVVVDTLPDHLTFANAQIGGGFTGVQTFTSALPAANTDCIGGACVIELSPGTTLPGQTGTVPTVGTVTIRAFVK